MKYSTQSLRLISALAVLSMLCLRTVASGESPSAQNDLAASPIVAYVGGHKITLSEVEQAQPDEIQGANAKILSARFAAFMAQRQAALQLIDDQLLAQEAARQHMSVDDLIKKITANKLKTPSEEALQIYYLGAQTDIPYSDARDKIIQHVAVLEQKKLLKDYNEELRKRAGVRIVLMPPRVQVAAGDAPATGPADAPITLIEFADYQCPYCRQMQPAVNTLLEQYKGKIRYVYKNFPLPSHPFAEKAAEAALCAGQQGQYWLYHDELFSQPPNTLDEPTLKKTAADIKLDTAKFDSCLDSNAEAADVKASFDEGRNIGISGTPSFVINGYFISGDVPEEVLNEVVGQLIYNARAQAARNESGPTRQAVAREAQRAESRRVNS
ncbi:MAG: thioredoxin domain-containing protein [Candidatus Binataceae bacterium]